MRDRTPNRYGAFDLPWAHPSPRSGRSEERRVGKEGASRREHDAQRQTREQARTVARPYFFVHTSFLFQAEDGIRDLYVTGVQTCALPISAPQMRDLDV